MLTSDSFSTEDSTYQKETIRMECQSVLSGEKNKKNIMNLLSAELAQRVVNVKR